MCVGPGVCDEETNEVRQIGASCGAKSTTIQIQTDRYMHMAGNFTACYKILVVSSRNRLLRVEGSEGYREAFMSQ